MGVFWLVDNFDTLVGIPPGFSQAWLVLFADLVHSQMLEYDGDWKTYFDTPAFPESAACVTGMSCNMLTHGVNIGQAIKSEAVWYRRSQDETDADSTFIRMRKLDQYHGVPSGMYQADEHLAGALPSHGTETCAVVEAVVSYAQSGAILGDASLFERAERITYNALPASMTKDTWERVYLQGSNEYNATSAKPFIWITDGADSPVFGLEGNYGCCTAKFVMNRANTLPQHYLFQLLTLSLHSPPLTLTIFQYACWLAQVYSPRCGVDQHLHYPEHVGPSQGYNPFGIH